MQKIGGLGQNPLHRPGRAVRGGLCRTLAGQGVAVSYVDLWGDEGKKTRRTKAASKTKYTCPSCGLNAWAKP